MPCHSHTAVFSRSVAGERSSSCIPQKCSPERPVLQSLPCFSAVLWEGCSLISAFSPLLASSAHSGLGSSLSASSECLMTPVRPDLRSPLFLSRDVRTAFNTDSWSLCLETFFLSLPYHALPFFPALGYFFSGRSHDCPGPLFLLPNALPRGAHRPMAFMCPGH